MKSGPLSVRWYLLPLLVAAVAGSGCPEETDAPPAPKAEAPPVGPKSFGLYLGELHVADVKEERSARSMTRTTRLRGADQDASTLELDFGARGFVTGARYQRTGKKGSRQLELVGRTLTDKVTGAGLKIPGEHPLSTFESLHVITVAPGTYAVTVLDVASAEVGTYRLVVDDKNNTIVDAAQRVVATVARATGLRDGPGVFAELAVREDRQRYPIKPPRVQGDTMCLFSALPLPTLSLNGPGQRAEGDHCVRFDKNASLTDSQTAAHRAAQIFMEADAPAVRTFAAGQSKGNVIADATALVATIHEKLDTSRGGGPPSALGTLERWTGDCDDATALLVASLRALGHAARPVVGYRVVDGTYGPHAWAEVFVPAPAGAASAATGEWLMADALVPGVGRLDDHLRLFTGLGGTLTMGRVLAAWMPTQPGTPTQNKPAVSP